MDAYQHVAETALLPRERLQRSGATGLRDHELVALMIGTGVAGRPVDRVARDVIALLDSERTFPDLSTLARITGLGPARAAGLTASFELARRILCPARRRIRAPADVLPVVDHYADRTQEYFLAVSLNGAHEVTATRVVTIGLVNRTVVHPREVFADLIAERAAAVILAHNHPSGNLEPSAEDGEVTRRLVSAGQLLGIPVLDHIIFGARGFYSFLEHDGL